MVRGRRAGRAAAAAGAAALALLLALGTPAAAQSFFDLKANDAQGNPVDFQEFKGKVVLGVNVASQCGYTDRAYVDLQKLQKKYSAAGLVILAFPCNQFGEQEPLPAAEVETKMRAEYGSTFRFMEKVDVNGDGTHPVFDFMKEADSLSIRRTPDVLWNFEKFLVNRRGDMYKRYLSADQMTGEHIERDIQLLLAVRVAQQDF